MSPSKNSLRSDCFVSGCTYEIFPIARPTIVRTVTGASASKSLQEMFPLSVSSVQYRPGLRLSAGGDPAVVTCTRNDEAKNVPLKKEATISVLKFRFRF